MNIKDNILKITVFDKNRGILKALTGALYNFHSAHSVWIAAVVSMQLMQYQITPPQRRILVTSGDESYPCPANCLCFDQNWGLLLPFVVIFHPRVFQ